MRERTEFLSQGEHAELLALVDFPHERMVEKLEAPVVLAWRKARLLAGSVPSGKLSCHPSPGGAVSQH